MFYVKYLCNVSLEISHTKIMIMLDIVSSSIKEHIGFVKKKAGRILVVIANFN
jgi:hypothetical protein